MKVLTTGRIPVKSWCDDLDEKTIEQANNLSNLPFAVKHIALMPDAHSGYGMPIGGVLATKGVVVPNAVGVDIGCGMIASKTNYPTSAISRNQLLEIVEIIKSTVPVGFNRREVPIMFEEMDKATDDLEIVFSQKDSLAHQVGTLGGGNHFIEIDNDQDGKIWFMVHTGSRNLGKKVCDHYNAIAKEENLKWFSVVDPKSDLAFLPVNSQQGLNYIREAAFCQEFALINRACIRRFVELAFAKVLGDSFSVERTIDTHHNFVSIENHFKQNLYVHRKGAIRAFDGMMGIIPGSQGTKSFIVRGLGNKESFASCSHGAGRKMGRMAAIKKLSLEDELKLMDGIIHSIQAEGDLDEAPGAYKDIDVVMESQKDLVEIVHELVPLAVIKG